MIFQNILTSLDSESIDLIGIAPYEEFVFSGCASDRASSV